MWIEFRNLLKSLLHVIEETEEADSDVRQDKREEVTQETRSAQQKPQKVSVKEIEDEFWQDYYKLPKSSVHILESDSPESHKMKESLFTHGNKDPMSIDIDNLENSNLPPPYLSHHQQKHQSD